VVNLKELKIKRHAALQKKVKQQLYKNCAPNKHCSLRQVTHNELRDAVREAASASLG
jgi:hypothetical protein